MRLSSTTTGDGPKRIALIHGQGANGAVWRGFSELALATGEFTITTVDLRGHGESRRAENHQYRISDFAADVVDTLPVGLHSIVGHSLGGRVLFHVVDRLRPAHVVYLDPGFRLDLPTTGVRAALLWHTPGINRVMGLLSRRTQKEWGVDNIALAKRANRQWDRSMMLGVFREHAFRAIVPAAPIVPWTLVLSAQGNTVVPPEMATRLAEYGWDIRHLPEAGHGFWITHPRQTYQIVADVL